MIAGDRLMKRAEESLHRLITMEALKSPIVVGHSLGATLTEGFASESQKRATYVRWASRTPHALVVVIDRSRHFVMFDQPERFARALDDAISR
jgi:pimeloyl-ACP methyl ester carboxylesterase